MAPGWQYKQPSPFTHVERFGKVAAVMVETWIEKDNWGDGPWQTEPDRVLWRHNGIVCLALRHVRWGNWCAYVGVGPDHPYHRHSESDVPEAVQEAAHGGLTFAGECMDDDRPMRERVCHVPEPGEADELWWFGFDCAHGFDLAPGMVAFEREHGFPEPPSGYKTYKPLPWVKERITEMAEGLGPPPGYRDQS